MPLPSFLERLFGRAEASKDAAKNRLKLVLMHDRAAIPPAILEQIRAEMLTVLSRYVEFDQQALEFNLERSEGTVALLANVPILRVRPEIEAAQKAAEAEGASAEGTSEGSTEAPPAQGEPSAEPALAST